MKNLFLAFILATVFSVAINQQFFYATLVSSLAPFGSSVSVQLSATAKDPLDGPSAVFHDEL